MAEMRTTTIQIQEHGTHTALNVSASENTSFSLSFGPKKFADPQVAELEKVVSNQRTEILNARSEIGELNVALEEARAVNRSAKKAARPARRRR